jgi:class 3 adenylate cyclase
MSKNNSSINALFEKAIASSEKYRFINYKALAGELAGRRQHKVGNHIMSQTYLNNARNDYQQWGAIAKVKQLESSFKDIFSTSILTQKSQSTDESLVAGMDLNLVLQANQAVKNAKDIDSLLVQLMNVIIKYSSADKGCLLVKNKSELMVTARYTVASGAESITEYADNEMLPLSIIKYVIRLKKLLILNNPSQIAEYSANRYFKKNHPKSLICYPILKQGNIFGVLFLENYLHEGVFNEKKISILNLISAQVAVSLDNAFLYENLENKVLERTEKIMAEKGIVDEMLENILPKASIDELKRTGKTTAQKFEGITILMADIKGFTKISEVLSPEELIAKIDFYFRSFDMIMEKYKLEKIKTIGDAYMAAGGLMGNINESAMNMVLAALEMQECIFKENIGDADADKLEMRIGLNTGTVIAGVVGIKKYQYDIWGDAVNIAARMEQQSEPGRVNVSVETYALTKNLVNYTFRGEIEGKNKGLMKMYYVESIIS